MYRRPLLLLLRAATSPGNPKKAASEDAENTATKEEEGRNSIFKRNAPLHSPFPVGNLPRRCRSRVASETTTTTRQHTHTADETDVSHTRTHRHTATHRRREDDNFFGGDNRRTDRPTDRAGKTAKTDCDAPNTASTTSGGGVASRRGRRPALPSMVQR